MHEVVKPGRCIRDVMTTGLARFDPERRDDGQLLPALWHPEHAWLLAVESSFRYGGATRIVVFDVENNCPISSFDLDLRNLEQYFCEFESWSNDGSLVQVCWSLRQATTAKTISSLQLMDPHTGSVALELQSRCAGVFAPNSRRHGPTCMA